MERVIIILFRRIFPEISKQSLYRKRYGRTKRYAFKNSERFIFFIKHAESFYKQASLSPLEIKPILLFYGMSQLLKACLLTTDPSYPSHASVLAHGVTARKRKKQNYSFRDDEVKVQQWLMYSCNEALIQDSWS